MPPRRKMVKILTSQMSQSHSNEFDLFVHNHLEELLDYFQIEYSVWGNRYNFVCPVHDCSDNPNAVLLYKNEGWVFWRCQTHNCHIDYGSSGKNLIRGILESRERNECSDKRLKEFLENFGTLQADPQQVEQQSILRFINMYGTNGAGSQPDNRVTRDMIRQRLQLQPIQFLDRGLSPAILDKYDIGLCKERGKFMFDRVVIPLYNETATHMVGCTGRATKNVEPKWLHSEDLKPGDVLFNYWYAKDFMKEFRCAILCEGPCDALKLIDNKIPALSMFNTELKQGQINLLDKCGVTNLIMMLDNDKAGVDGLAKIKEKYSRYYKVFGVDYSTHDPGELTANEIDIKVKPQLRKLISTNAY